jgi:hypothetical protein
MNSTRYRLVFSNLRGMLIAAEEAATAADTAGGGEACSGQSYPEDSETTSMFPSRHASDPCS